MNSSESDSGAKRYALLFPGQGSQAPGMLTELNESFAVVGDTFAEASDILGFDLWQLASEGPAEKQRLTQYTQPLMFCSGIALLRVWRSEVAQLPLVIAGHSLGEFCALTAAGCIEFPDAVSLVAKRAQLMANAVPEGEGGMAALLGMEDQAVVTLCESLTGDRVVEAANFNAPGQVAVSGHSDAIENLVAVAKEHGARKAVMLPVSVPNHSSLMREAGLALAAEIEQLEWQQPKIPVMQNVDATVADDLTALKASLKKHVFSPVQWTRSVQQMISTAGIELFVELGPAKVLAGLGKRIDRSVPVAAVDSSATLVEAVAALGLEASVS